MVTYERNRVVTWAVRLALAGLVAAVLAALAFAFGLLPTRPILRGEAEILFEASRIRHNFPLFTDPRAGVFEYGSYPSRFYVPYPPIWSWVLSHVPEAFAETGARLVGALAWFGVLAAIACRATPRCRLAATAGALYVAGIGVLANVAATARPDAIAVALAALALDRCVRREKLDAVATVLFCAAALMTPHAMGALLGVLVASMLISPRPALRHVLAVALVGAACLDALEITSNGAWHEHFAGSFGQPRSLVQAVSGALGPMSLLGALLVAAAWLAWRRRHHRGPVLALGGMLGAFAWACLAFSRPGAAAQDWLETGAACVVVLAHSPLPGVVRPRAAKAAAIAFAAQAIYSAGVSWEGVVESFRKQPARAALAQHARQACLAEPNDVVVSDEPGFELETNGRILATVFTLSDAVHAGKLPLETAIADSKRTEVRCVMSARSDFETFLPEVRDVFRDRFRLVEEQADWKLYARR